MTQLFQKRFYNQDELRAAGAGAVGDNVHVHEDCNIHGLEKIQFGSNVRIDAYVTIIATGPVSIGSYVHIASYCLLSGGEGISLGDFAGLSHGVRIYSRSDDYSGAGLTNPTVPDRFKRVNGGPVTLGKHVIIGSGTIILPGVTIEDGASVGALSLVTKSLPGWTTYFGARREKSAHAQSNCWKWSTARRDCQRISKGGLTIKARSTMNQPIYLSPPDMSGIERDRLLDAFDSNWIAPLGPHVDAFEREFAEKLGVRQAVALSSGTAALHLALLAAGVGPGDTVVTSTLTFAASANVIRYVGAEPVFIDSEPQSWNMDPQLLEDEFRDAASRGRAPAAALVVDLCGQCADWEPIGALCRQYSVCTIEDAAESLGASYRGRHAGTLADIGCFSFNGNKIITTSGGGMLVTENEAWADTARHLATQARDPAPHYQHSKIGFNYRLSNLLAAVGRGQLAVLPDRVAKRRDNFDFYRRAWQTCPESISCRSHLLATLRAG